MHLWTLFPRLSFFFLWLTPSTLLRQVQHIFGFPGLKGGLSIRTSRRSAMDCCVYQHRLLLNVYRCWRNSVINCTGNFKPKGKNSFCGFFMFCCHSILIVLQRLQEQYQGCKKIQQQPS